MVRGILLDIAGVLYQGDHALPGAADAFTRIRDAIDAPLVKQVFDVEQR